MGTSSVPSLNCDDITLDKSCLGDNTFEITSKAITDGEIVVEKHNNKSRRLWKGKGVFDDLMEAFDANITIQHDNGRIVGAEYAKAYTNLLTSAMAQASDIAHKNQELQLRSIELCLKKQLECARLKVELAKLKLEEDKMDADLQLTKLKQENMIAHTKLFDRQTEGFDDNITLKLLKIQLDSFAMIFSSGMLNDDTLPEALSKNTLTNTYNTVKDRVIPDASRNYRVLRRIVSSSNIAL